MFCCFHLSNKKKPAFRKWFFLAWTFHIRNVHQYSINVNFSKNKALKGSQLLVFFNLNHYFFLVKLNILYCLESQYNILFEYRKLIYTLNILEEIKINVFSTKDSFSPIKWYMIFEQFRVFIFSESKKFSKQVVFRGKQVIKCLAANNFTNFTVQKKKKLYSK